MTWAPEEQQRSSSDRWVNPKKWDEVVRDKKPVKEWRGRILSSPVSVGYELWGDDGKPHRAKNKADLSHIKPRQDGKFGPDKIKLVWAIAFGDIAANSVVVWTITQVSIHDALRSIVAKWGAPEAKNDPFGYDVLVTQYKKDGKTFYAIEVPGAESGTARYACPQIIASEWDQMKRDGFDLEALWSGGDPFPSAGGSNSPAPPDNDDVPF